MIRLETSVRTGIENNQLPEISKFERNWSADIPKRFPRVRQRTGMSPIYNCHGLTFASRRTRIFDPRSIPRILKDDKWEELDIQDVMPGDVVVYFSAGGEANHSGIVLELNALKVPIICSKWGSAGEYIHQLADHDPIYGPVTKFFRCRL